MALDPLKLKELRRAVAAAPDDLTLRLELIQLLLEAQMPQDAWHLCIRLLNERPKNVEALRLAREAARTVGATNRMREYEDRLAALGAMPEDAEQSGRTFHIRGRTLRLIRGSGGKGEDSKVKTKNPCK